MTVSTKDPHHRRPAAFWLIVKEEAGQEEILTIHLEGEGETLPVFGFEDEAGMFLSLGTLGAGWRIKQTTVGELTRALLDSGAGVEFVSLDPLPELVCREMIGLVSLRKEQFIDRYSDNTVEIV